MAKLQPPKNPNYCATVVKVGSLVPLANCDNLQGFPIMGMQAIVDLQTQVGDVGILLPTEVELSGYFTKYNNLYRHAELNDDQEKKGYLEDNRRVKSLKLRGHRSDALFLPLSSLGFGDYTTLKEGDTFDQFAGKEVCRKFEKPIVLTRSQTGGIKAVDRRVDVKFIPEQFDITHFQRRVEGLDANTAVVITQKLHGTNIRIANTYVTRKPNWRERIASKLGVAVREQDFAEVFGSHHVIKDANNPNHRHFYDFDLWSREGKKLEGRIPQGFILYGELIGWAGEKPIQPHYTYNVEKGKCELYVYRVALVNPQGRTVDLSWRAVKDFCNEIGVKHVPELVNTYVRFVENPVWSELVDRKFDEVKNPSLTNEEPVPLSVDSPCDEGVCVRIEGLTPRIYKIKAPLFLAHETKVLDSNEQEVAEDDEIAESGTPIGEVGEDVDVAAPRVSVANPASNASWDNTAGIEPEVVSAIANKAWAAPILIEPTPRIQSYPAKVEGVRPQLRADEYISKMSIEEWEEMCDYATGECQ